MSTANQNKKEQFVEDGFIIIKDCIPDDLLQELRVLSEKYRKIARRSYGAQTQRLQPLERYSETAEKQLLDALISLPILQEIVASVLSQHHHISMDYLGMMFEPKYLPYCMPWHRDWRDNCQGIDMQAWYDVYRDLDFFNQINCPLYQDQSLWVVRGSHNRMDTPEEQALFPTRPIMAPYNDIERKTNRLGDFLNFFRKKDYAQRESSCLAHCNMMPQAEKVVLQPGDALLYRNTIWHLGNYMPNEKRATFHTIVTTDRYKEWMYTEKTKLYEQQDKGPLTWQDPYAQETFASHELSDQL